MRAVGRSAVTRDGQIKGKLPYMSPEQVRGKEITRRSDIYAAATVLWEALTGRRLFAGDNDANVLEQVLVSLVASPSRYASSVSPQLDELVLKGLDRDPHNRFESAEAMALALEECEKPANPSQVAAWLRRVADERLKIRALAVEEIERGTYSGRQRVLGAQLAPGESTRRNLPLGGRSTRPSREKPGAGRLDHRGPRDVRHGGDVAPGIEARRCARFEHCPRHCASAFFTRSGSERFVDSVRCAPRGVPSPCKPVAVRLRASALETESRSPRPPVHFEHRPPLEKLRGSVHGR